MLSQINGIVQEIQERPVMNGTKTAYDLIVSGQKYGAGLFAPKCKVGDYVTFTRGERNGYAEVAARTLRVGKAPADQAGAVANAPYVAPQASSGSFDKRQDAISRQAASNTAIAFMQLLASQEALPVPASKSKGDKQAVLETLLLGYETRFYEANTGNVWKSIAPAGSKTEAAASSPQVVEDSAWE